MTKNVCTSLTIYLGYSKHISLQKSNDTLSVFSRNRITGKSLKKCYWGLERKWWLVWQSGETNPSEHWTKCEPDFIIHHQDQTSLNPCAGFQIRGERTKVWNMIKRVFRTKGYLFNEFFNIYKPGWKYSTYSRNTKASKFDIWKKAGQVQDQLHIIFTCQESGHAWWGMNSNGKLDEQRTWRILNPDLWRIHGLWSQKATQYTM